MISEVKNRILNLAGQKISAVAPESGQILTWSGSQWEPAEPAGLSEVTTEDISDFDSASAAIADAQIAAVKGENNGLASLDSNGKLVSSQLPPLSLTNVNVVDDEEDQLELTAEAGDVAIRTDESKTYIHNGGTAGTMADWTEILVPTGAVISVNGQSGAVSLTTDDIEEGEDNLYFTEDRVEAVEVGGDATGTVGDLTVTAIQGVPVSDNSPANNAVLRYNDGDEAYEPVVLDVAAVSGLQTALDAKAADADLTTLEGRVDTLETTVAGLDSSALEDRLETAEGNISSLTSGLADKADAAQVALDIAAAVEDLATEAYVDAAVTGLASTASVTAAISDAVEDLATAASVTAVQNNVDGLSSLVSAVEDDLESLETEVASKAQAAAVDAKFALVPQFTKVTVTYENEIFAAESDRVTLQILSLPPKSKLVGVTLRHTSAFTGDGLESLTVSLGAELTADEDGPSPENEEFYATAFDIFQAAGLDVFSDSLLYMSKTTNPHYATLVFKANDDFDNITLDNGELEVHIGYVVLP